MNARHLVRLRFELLSLSLNNELMKYGADLLIKENTCTGRDETCGSSEFVCIHATNNLTDVFSVADVWSAAQNKLHKMGKKTHR